MVKVKNVDDKRSKEDEDDDFFEQENKTKQEKNSSWSFPLCCLNWSSDTWWGIGTVIAGMLIQGALGIVSIWGNIVIYVTSKLRAEDPNLST